MPSGTAREKDSWRGILVGWPSCASVGTAGRQPMMHQGLQWGPRIRAPRVKALQQRSDEIPFAYGTCRWMTR